LHRAPEQLLDGVERLPVMPDEDGCLLALNGHVDPAVPDLGRDFSIDIHGFEQAVDEVEGIILRDGETILLAFLLIFFIGEYRSGKVFRTGYVCGHVRRRGNLLTRYILRSRIVEGTHLRHRFFALVFRGRAEAPAPTGFPPAAGV